MSFDTSWDVDECRNSFESEEQWLLKKAFMERWKNNYPKDRLVYLATAFANIEFLGCRYPNEVMLEVSRLSEEVAAEYRKRKKTKLQRTFVSASDAAADRAKGIKREGGVVTDSPPTKSVKINFVPQGYIETNKTTEQETINFDLARTDHNDEERSSVSNNIENIDYLTDLLKIKLLDLREFNERMFETKFGKFVLITRVWTTKIGNILYSCQACRLKLTSTFKNNIYTFFINDQPIGQAAGLCKADAKPSAEEDAFNNLQNECITVLVREEWISEGRRISVSDVSGKAETFGTKETFGPKLDNSVAAKMMKSMGWQGGGLGASSQGISEPIQPQIQMVNRLGLGCTPDIRHLRAASYNLMNRYIESDSLDTDLVFSSEFSKEERGVLHKCAQNVGLVSKSYTSNEERFIVVKKKKNPFALVRAIIDKGGDTAKYKVFIPAALAKT